MNEIKLLLFIGISGMLLLFTGFLLIFIFSQRKKYEYQRKIQLLKESQNNQLIEAAIRSEEKERHRIAESLHDDVGVFLSSSKLYFQGISIDQSDRQNKHLYNKGEELLNEAISRIRGISHNLHSAVLQQLGLNEAIRHLAEKMEDESILQIVTKLDDSIPIYHHENHGSIFRLIQELLNNIIKHAHATQITIASQCMESIHRFSISHNGSGLRQADFEELRFRKEGFGIKNIQNRIILLKGEISFFNEKGEYHIKIDIPLQSIQYDYHSYR